MVLPVDADKPVIFWVDVSFVVISKDVKTVLKLTVVFDIGISVVDLTGVVVKVDDSAEEVSILVVNSVDAVVVVGNREDVVSVVDSIDDSAVVVSLGVVYAYVLKLDS